MISFRIVKMGLPGPEAPAAFSDLLLSFDKRSDHLRVGERGGVANLVRVVLGDLAQDAAHDFAGARLRQAGRKLDFVRHGYRADFFADMVRQFLF
jgi:hypothetical protein